MRSLHLTLSFSPGGRREAITTLVRGLRAEGAVCDVGCLDELGCEPSTLDGVADEVIVLDRRSLVDLGAVRRLVAHCRRREIEVIHAHDAASQFVGALVRLAAPRIKLMMTFHRSLGFESARLRDKLRNAFASALSATIVTGSRERREHFLRENFVSSKKMVRIPFGVDVDRFQPDAETRRALRAELGLGPDVVLVGAIGHFGLEKGLDRVIAGFETLIAGGVDRQVVLLLFGRGAPDDERRLHAQAAALETGRVRFMGFRGDIDRWLQALDLLVHAPRSEAFGLVLIEAMAAGLPVVATAVGGIPDIVRHGRTGLLVDAGGDSAELASALRTLVMDDALRRRLADEALRTARTEYNLEAYARRHLRLYEDLVAGRSPRGVDESDASPAPRIHDAKCIARPAVQVRKFAETQASTD